MSETPSDLLYTKEHEWIRITGNKGTVGITDHAQRALGDIVYVELPGLDDEIDAGDEFGTVESVKAVSPLFMPMSGRVIDINSDLKEQPESINEDCYGDGWLIRLELTHPEDQQSLMTAEEYAAYLQELEE